MRATESARTPSSIQPPRRTGQGAFSNALPRTLRGSASTASPPSGFFDSEEPFWTSTTVSRTYAAIWRNSLSQFSAVVSMKCPETRYCGSVNGCKPCSARSAFSSCAPTKACATSSARKTARRTRERPFSRTRRRVRPIVRRLSRRLASSAPVPRPSLTGWPASARPRFSSLPPIRPCDPSCRGQAHRNRCDPFGLAQTGRRAALLP